MAKVLNYLICVFLLCDCHDNSVPEVSVKAPTQATIEDVPVSVDTLKKVDTVQLIVQPAPIFHNVQQIDNFTPQPPAPLPPRINEVYNSYVGVKEATGNNDGLEVERFLKNVGLGKGFPWCAAFVKTCLLEAGVTEASRINGMALSCENKSKLVYSARRFAGSPRQGDVFTLWYANLNRIGHTGFFDRRINSTIYESVEGNTNGAGSREGDGVYRKKRSFNATHSISRWP